MKKFLYVREKGYISYQPSTATQTFQVKGAGVHSGDYFDHTFADTGDAQARMRVTITSAAANTGNRGSDYANANTEIGTVTVLEDEALVISGNNLVIPNVSGDVQEGYTIKDNDLIEIEDCFKQDTGELLYSLDKLLAIEKASTTSTIVRFKAAEASAADDTIQFIYPSATGIDSHRKICNYFDALLNGSNANDDGFIEIDRGRGGKMPKELLDAGVYIINANIQP